VRSFHSPENSGRFLPVVLAVSLLGYPGEIGDASYQERKSFDAACRGAPCGTSDMSRDRNFTELHTL
jgi:hypothetical protein